MSNPATRLAIGFTVVLASLALNGCANGVSQPAVQRPNIITLQSGQKVCGVHYVPLITIGGPEEIGANRFLWSSISEN